MYESEVESERGRGKSRMRWMDRVKKYVSESDKIWVDDGEQDGMNEFCSRPRPEGTSRQKKILIVHINQTRK